MTETRKLRVFLCHSSTDKPIVRELYQRLNAEGWIDPWLDEKKLLPGQNWEMEIENVVETTDSVIICLSSNSVNKEGFIQKEIRKVLEISEQKPDGTIFVIPIRLDNCQPPQRLRPLHYADYFPHERKIETFQLILQSLEVRLKTLLPVDVQQKISESDETAFMRLSRREKTVLLLMSEGKTNRQIGKALFLGEGTIRNYVSTILSKLGFNNRVDAAGYAVKNNLKVTIRQ
jgi:DNA-binding NarL/FixJ family response regulator